MAWTVQAVSVLVLNFLHIVFAKDSQQFCLFCDAHQDIDEPGCLNNLLTLVEAFDFPEQNEIYLSLLQTTCYEKEKNRCKKKNEEEFRSLPSNKQLALLRSSCINGVLNGIVSNAVGDQNHNKNDFKWSIEWPEWIDWKWPPDFFPYPPRRKTPSPTSSPTLTPVPTSSPTLSPTKFPSAGPTKIPTKFPTSIPTEVPTAIPTKVPTAIPTKVPTAIPTVKPTHTISEVPTAAPSTNAPTEEYSYSFENEKFESLSFAPKNSKTALHPEAYVFDEMFGLGENAETFGQMKQRENILHLSVKQHEPADTPKHAELDTADIIGLKKLLGYAPLIGNKDALLPLQKKPTAPSPDSSSIYSATIQLKKPLQNEQTLQPLGNATKFHIDFDSVFKYSIGFMSLLAFITVGVRIKSKQSTILRRSKSMKKRSDHRKRAGSRDSRHNNSVSSENISLESGIAPSHGETSFLLPLHS